MCYWYYYYHVPCNHASQVTTAPCDAASATGRSCQLVLQQDEPEKISREEPCPGCADRCPENGYQGEEQHGNSATGNMQSDGEEEGLNKVYEYNDDDDGHTVMTGYDRPAQVGNRPPPSHPLAREYHPPLSDIDERSEAGSQAASLPTHTDAGAPDTAQPNVAALEAKTKQFWQGQEHDRLAGDLNKALRLSRREAKAKSSHDAAREAESAAAHEAEIAQAVRESEQDLEYRRYLETVDLDKATQQSLKDQAETEHRENREREDLQRAEDSSWRDAEAVARREEEMKRKLEAETLRAKEESIDTATAWKASRGWVLDEEVFDGNDDASTVMTGSTWRSAQSRRTSPGHVDDESDAGSIAHSSRATVRPSPPLAASAAAASSSHHHPASARATPRPHWTRSNDPEYPPSRPPTYTTLPRTYPTEPNPQIPSPPLRSPSPVATVRGVLANASAEEEKRREAHSRRFDHEEAEEEGSVNPAPPVNSGRMAKAKSRFPTPSKSVRGYLRRMLRLSQDDDGEADSEEESEGDGDGGDDGTSTVLGGGASISRSLLSSERGGVGGAAESV
ncbi:hypothetical protein LTR91_015468 [Friedmanniomyces endolithicus]|uniref:Uncharacterized protein n=1 Tax=Friedmanniomyces endolithicus TaxID=329885 RepID=A0AAN6K9N6_9PEZI|nr:hypothetical protein LTR75_008096 [Friedmanniomyces endolithicus]KAK0809979.1 hypothetical protein LTR59_002381 [Friedmanniomyces endolithicus]KAK0863013.1 hypothetical protein LTS02_006819 [Friedmanniomyces endolithicus]KAK0917853.1 hypothetical protein LTR57_012324 [Friedmanniomyces endolithicus]KAK0971540.1 hypothetical protein LTR91_015468 [Friedmanniomyces endolithicus]